MQRLRSLLIAASKCSNITLHNKKAYFDARPTETRANLFICKTYLVDLAILSNVQSKFRLISNIFYRTTAILGFSL